MSPAKRIATAPLRFVRGAWRFVNPQLKAGRVPFTRTVVVLQVIGVLTFLGYTLVKKGTHFPWQEEPYFVEVIVPDAEGLNPKKEPAAGVAGANAGKVVDVEYENGRARVTLRLDPELRGKIFANATASIRPTSILQTLIVNILPGDPETGPLPDGTPIEPGSTDSFVHIDELTSVLDADTQAQAQILISELAEALRGREPELRRILLEVGELTEGATPLAEALAERRRLVTALVGHLDELFVTLRQRGVQLAHTVEVASDTLAVTSARAPELSATLRELAPTLVEADRALAATRILAEPLTGALDDLNPVADQLLPIATGLRELAPSLDAFVATAAGLVEDGALPVRLFADGLAGLSGRIEGYQIPALRELVDLVDLLYKYRNGFKQFGETWSGAFSVNDNSGTYGQVALVDSYITPEGLGLSASATESSAGEPTELALMLAEALELTCAENPAACLMRFNLPGLPPEPITSGEDG